MNVQQVEQLLEQLQATLDELAEIQAQKDRALASMNTAELERLSELEGVLSARMKACSDKRKELVAAANSSKGAKATFRELLHHLPVPQRQSLIDRFEQVREHARQVKQRAASNWFATYRTHQHVKDLVELIAHAGQADESDSGHQGLFLDSTA
jgi:chromosome segregation ATPase